MKKPEFKRNNNEIDIFLQQHKQQRDNPEQILYRMRFPISASKDKDKLEINMRTTVTLTQIK